MTGRKKESLAIVKGGETNYNRQSAALLKIPTQTTYVTQITGQK